MSHNLVVRRFPWAVYTLILCGALAFLFELAIEEELLGLVHYFGMIPARLLRPERFGSSMGEGLLTLLSALFLHGGWMHLLGNLWFLFLLGRGVEARLGALRFFYLFFAAGVLGGICQALAEPGALVPVIGSSGAVSGVLGAYLVLFPRSRVVALVPLFVFFPLVEVPGALFVVFWAAVQVTSGLASIFSPGAVNDQIAWFSHIGGLGLGVLLGLFWRKVWVEGGAAKEPSS